MEENRDLTLSLGEVSLNENLGLYYINMKVAKIHYSKEYYGTIFDDNGVPMIPYQTGNKYFAVNISQYGFILLDEYNTTKSTKLFNQLIALADCLVNIVSIEEDEAIWWHDVDNKKYNIIAPWASAMAQGEAISFLLRIFQITSDPKYLNISKMAANFLLNENHPKRVAIRDENQDLWLEEFPSNPPGFVLNGFIYALFGLYDLYRVSRSEKILIAINECLITLDRNIHKFDSGYWSYYDLLKKELVRYYYQKNVHVLELEVLYLLTNNEKFNYYAKRWKRQINPLNFTFVKLMYRVLPRIKKIRK